MDYQRSHAAHTNQAVIATSGQVRQDLQNTKKGFPSQGKTAARQQSGKMDSVETKPTDMANVDSRTESFLSWPNSAVSALMLAFAGFFYSGKEDHSDEVTCYACGVRLQNWLSEHLPLIRHNEASPSCEFVRNQLHPGNSSLSKSSVNGDTATTADTDTSPQYGHQYSDNQPKAKNHLSSTSLLLPSQSHSRLPVPVRIEAKPLFQSDGFSSSTAAMEQKTLQYYQDKNLRVASFYKIDAPWPMNAPISAEEMADAGLFFTGVKDKVQCAYCRGKLYNWANGDTAFGEHKRHFPKCSYVMLKLREKEEQENLKPEADCCEEREPGQLAAMSSDCMPSTTPFNFMQITAVKSITAMGYDTQLISAALKKLLSKLGIKEFSADKLQAVTTESLLDAVFEAEETWPQTGSKNSEIGEQQLELVSPDPTPVESLHVAPPSSGYSSSGAVAAPELKGKKSEPRDDRIKELEQENSTLKNLTTCRVCLAKDVNILFLPCRHLVCCETCGYQVKACPLCRATIIGSVKTFLA